MYRTFLSLHHRSRVSFDEVETFLPFPAFPLPQFGGTMSEPKKKNTKKNQESTKTSQLTCAQCILVLIRYQNGKNKWIDIRKLKFDFQNSMISMYYVLYQSL